MILLVSFLLASVASFGDSHSTGFVHPVKEHFDLNGKAWFYGGTNTCYFMCHDTYMIEDVMQLAVRNNLSVIRTWVFNDIYTPSSTEDYYLHYWNGTGVSVNVDGSGGLPHIDEVLVAARKYGLKLVLTLVNYWDAYGGIDMYLRWFGLPHSREEDRRAFYTESALKNEYKRYVETVVGRTNSLNGLKYSEDDTIFAWQLCNECRCKGCVLEKDKYLIRDWADEMSRFVASKDPNHMISFGDEGFFSMPSKKPLDWAYNGIEGYDFRDILRLPHISYGTFHLYPDTWLKEGAWSKEWIESHLSAMREVGKPVVLEEFGIRDKTTRDSVYSEWYDLLFSGDVAGDHFWMLAGHTDDHTHYYGDDGFTIYDYDHSSLSVSP